MEEDELHSHEPPDQSGPPEGLFKPRMSLIRTPPRGEACSGDLSESDSTVKPGDSQEELLDCAAIVQIGGEFPAVDKNTSRQQDAESSNKTRLWTEINCRNTLSCPSISNILIPVSVLTNM